MHITMARGHSPIVPIQLLTNPSSASLLASLQITLSASLLHSPWPKLPSPPSGLAANLI